MERVDTAQLTQRVLGVVSDLVGELRGSPAPHVSVDDVLDRDLGIGSLERVELLVRLEREFGTRLADRVVTEAERPADLVEALRSGEHRPAEPPGRGREVQPAAAGGHPETARSLVEALRWHVDATPERRHVTLYEDDDRQRPVLYGELWDRAHRVARSLKASGIRPRSTVAVMLRTEADFFFVFYGILMAGAVPVPIYPPFRADRIEEFATRQAGILRNAESSLLVTFGQAERLAGLLRAQAPTLRSVVTATDLMEEGDSAPPVSISRDDPALIQYTSGSTGMPKGVLLTHGNLLANIRALGQAMALRPDDVVVSWLPLYHDMGLIGCWLGALYFGLPLVLMSPMAFLSRPSRWLWAIHRHAGTLSPAPNFAFDLCVTKVAADEIAGLDLSTWRAALNGSEPVSADTVERFTGRYAAYGFRSESMCPVYGMAECSVGLSASPVGRAPRIDRVDRTALERQRRARQVEAGAADAIRFVSCGPPVPDHAIRIVDPEGRSVGERIVGRIEFRGPSVMQGYYRDPKATAAIRHDGWLISGDLGYLADGEIFITGREKDLVIVGGRNVHPQEIEQLAASVSGIRRGCVAAFGVPDAATGTERLVVVAETRERDPARRERLRAAALDAIVAAAGLVPHAIIIADPGTVPKTSSGKLRRSATRDAYLAGALGRRPSVTAQWVRLILGNLRGRFVRGARTAVNVGYTIYVGLLFAATVLPLWAVLRILPVGPTCARLVHLWARCAMALSGCRMRVSGREHLANPGPALLLSNHASYIDVVVLMAALPRDFRFVAKRGLTTFPIVGHVVTKMGCLTIERADVSTRLAGADEVVEALRRGETLFLFPEGTFDRGPGLLPFRLGAFRAAVDTRCAVIPIALSGTREILPAYQKLFHRGPVTVTIGAPLQPQGEGWSEWVRLRDETRDWIEQNAGEKL